MPSRRAVVAGTLLACAGLLAGTTSPAGATTLNELIQRGVVRIGVLIGAPPFGMVDELGNPTGFDQEVAARLARYLGVRADYIPLTPPARIAALLSGRVDFLVATLNPTPERARSVMFSNPYSGFTMVVVTTGRPVTGLGDLTGQRVGATRGSAQEAALRRLGGNLQIVVFEDDLSVADALAAAQITAAALPDALVQHLARKTTGQRLNVGFTLYAQANSMAVRPGDFEILQWLNNTIYAMKANGELETIYRKWTDSRLPALDTF